MSQKQSASEATAAAFQAAQGNNAQQEQDNAAAQQQAVAQEPKPEEKVESATQQATPDFKNWAQENFGTDDVETIRARYTGYEALEKTANERQIEAEAARKEASEYKLKSETSPFANDFVKGLNELARNTNDPKIYEAYLKVNSIDTNALSHKEQVALRMQLEKGLSPADVQLLLDDTYSVNESLYDMEADDNTRTQKIENAKRLKEIQLEIAAKDAGKFLTDYKKSFGSQDEAKLKQEQQNQQYISEVRKVAPDIQNTYEGLKSVTLIPEKDGQPATTFDIVPSDAFKKDIPLYVENFMAQNNIPFTQEGIQAVRKHLDMVYVAQNFTEIVSTASQHAAAEREKQVRAEYANHTPRPADRGAGSGGKEVHLIEKTLAGAYEQKPNGNYKIVRKAVNTH